MEKFERFEKHAKMAVIMTLLVMCIWQAERISTLESRVLQLENDQTMIVSNMKRTVDLMADIVRMQKGKELVEMADG